MTRHSSIFRFFSSLKLALFLLLSLSCVLAFATLIESRYGMRASHLWIYNRIWFYFLLFLLGTNIFTAALARFPWKKRQTGFVLTHLGLLTLLFGSYITNEFGIDGTIEIEENGFENQVKQSDLELVLQNLSSGYTLSYPFTETPKKRESAMNHKGFFNLYFADGSSWEVDTFLPRVYFTQHIEPSPVPFLGQSAIHIQLQNSRVTFHDWLYRERPYRDEKIDLGPSEIVFTSQREKEKLSSLSLQQPSKHQQHKTIFGFLDVTVGQKNSTTHKKIPLLKESFQKGVWVDIRDSNFEFKMLGFYPHAIVRNNTLENDPNEPLNPALTILLRHKKQDHLVAERSKNPNTFDEGRYTLFARFRDLSAIHTDTPSSFQNNLPIQLSFISLDNLPSLSMSDMSEEGKESSDLHNKGLLKISLDEENNSLSYQSFGFGGVKKASGPLVVGIPKPLGWMDLELTLVDFLPHAVRTYRPVYIDTLTSNENTQNATNFMTALHWSFKNPRSVNKNSILKEGWLGEEGSTIISDFNNNSYIINFRKKRLQLPFNIYLKKFTMTRDPGTTKAASYQSSVRILDPKDTLHPPKEYNISMNEPLKYQKYTFYQASFIEEPNKPIVTILSVNYDPGRVIKYLGAIFLILGIIIMFYLNPHYFKLVFGTMS